VLLSDGASAAAKERVGQVGRLPSAHPATRA